MPAASAPSWATSTSWPSLSRVSRMNLAVTGSSSTSKTLLMVPPPPTLLVIPRVASIHESSPWGAATPDRYTSSGQVRRLHGGCGLLGLRLEPLQRHRHGLLVAPGAVGAGRAQQEQRAQAADDRAAPVLGRLGEGDAALARRDPVRPA